MILLTGGSGLLGRELRKHLYVYAPSHEQLDITKPIKNKHKINTVIHCAAFTDVDMADEQPLKCFNVNMGGTYNLLVKYKDIPFVYISTEYAEKPVNVYSISKLGAEFAVKMRAKYYLIIRTLFKKRPWTLDNAWEDQWTQGDYVDVIAKKIVQVIKDWDKKSKTVYVGTGRKTMYDLAKRTKPDVKPSSLRAFNTYGVKRPYDYK